MSSQQQQQQQQQKEPEVFETPDIDESSAGGGASAGADDAELAQTKLMESKNENIIQNRIHPQLSFEKFAGKIFDVSGGLSDAGVKAYLHEVGSMEQEYTLQRRKERCTFETPLERYNRLRDELATFKNDLDELVKAEERMIKKDESVLNVTGAISRELGSMDSELQAILGNRTYQPFLDENFREPSGVEQSQLLDRLIAQLQEVGSSQSNSTDDGKMVTKGDGRITYELFYNPSKDAARQKTVVGEMDRRLAAVEKTLGGMDVTALGFPDLHTAIHYLQRRLELLSNEKLAQVQRRIATLMEEIEQFEKVKVQRVEEDDAERVRKVNAIFNLMAKWDTALQQLPMVIGRLQSLKDLHEEAAKATLRIQAIDAEQSHVDHLLTKDRVALKDVKKSLSENMRVMLDNVKTLESRFEKIEARCKKL